MKQRCQQNGDPGDIDNIVSYVINNAPIENSNYYKVRISPTPVNTKMDNKDHSVLRPVIQTVAFFFQQAAAHAVALTIQVQEQTPLVIVNSVFRIDRKTLTDIKVEQTENDERDTK